MSVGPIVGLRPADLAQLESLLGEHHLPYEDCAEQSQIFCGVYHGNELIAAGGLEPADEYALLRSALHRRAAALPRQRPGTVD